MQFLCTRFSNITRFPVRDPAYIKHTIFWLFDSLTTPRISFNPAGNYSKVKFIYSFSANGWNDVASKEQV